MINTTPSHGFRLFKSEGVGEEGVERIQRHVALGVDTQMFSLFHGNPDITMESVV